MLFRKNNEEIEENAVKAEETAENAVENAASILEDLPVYDETLQTAETEDEIREPVAEEETENIAYSVPEEETAQSITYTAPAIDETVTYTAPADETVSYETAEEQEEPLTKRELREAELEEALDRKNRMGLLGTGSIVWSWILMSIPGLGLILAILWACGLCRKTQKKFLARAFLTLLLVAICLALIGALVYRWIFNLKLEDLPMVIETVTESVWSLVMGILSKN